MNSEHPILHPASTLTTLSNGLEIIVQEDHSSPVIATQAWCRAGSINEGAQLGAGLSHVLEHMLFKGTSTRGAGRIDQEVQDAGGYMNAYTSFDHTVYLINAPSTGTRVAVDILCDIMQHATLPDDELQKEKQVILREMDMLQDDPARRSGRRLFQTAYTRSPYRYPIIGLPDIYNQLSRDDVMNYYRAKYCPNNLFFVIVGDVNTPEIIDQIGEAFSKSGARSVPPENLPTEPKQTARREITEEAPIQLGHMHRAWHIPDIRHHDVPTLDVLSNILGGGRSSRLYHRIREKEALAHSIDAWTYNPGNPGLIGLSAVMDADKYSQTLSAIDEELDRVKIDGVTEDELQKTIKQAVASTFASRKTMQGQAQDLGHSWLVANDLSFSDNFLKRMQQTTTEEIQSVARFYLQPENQTTYALLPEGTTPKVNSVSSASTSGEIQKIELPNGLRLLLKEDKRLPFVEFRAVFMGGTISETAENNGISTLMAKMLLKGTTRRSADEIALEIESIGGHLDAYSGNNSFGVNLETLADDFETGLDLLGDVLLNPTFPDANLERERLALLAALQAQEDQLLQRTFRRMRQRLFGDAGYGLNNIGSETSLKKLQRNDLVEFHRGVTTPNNCVLAIFGNIDTDRVRQLVENKFANWTSDSKPDFQFTQSLPLTEPISFTEPTDKTQAVLSMGFPGTTINNDDRYALELIQESCSDLGSRLFMRIRDELGLAYYVGAQNMLGLAPGYFAFYAGTAPDKAELVQEEFLKEAKLLAEKGLSETELKRSKAKLLGQHTIARQELGHLAISTALDELYGLGFDNYIRDDAKFAAVSLEEVQRIAAKYLSSNNYVSAITAPEK